MPYKNEMKKAESHVEGVADLFKVLSKPDALKMLSRTGMGIENSAYAMEELGLTQKRYYSRLKELVDTGLVRKRDGVYRQTALGRMVYDCFLPAMGKVFDAREEVELIVYLEGTKIDSEVKKRILDELEIPSFAESTKIKLLIDYEDLAVTAIDLYDSAEESVLLASNYFDMRVIEAFFRASERGITNRVIMGKNRQSSKIQKLRSMLSVTFAKILIDFASNTAELKYTVRFADLPYTFCVVDGHLNLIEFSNPLNEGFIVALSIDDRGIGDKFTKLFEMFWEASEFHSAIDGLNYIKSS